MLPTLRCQKPPAYQQTVKLARRQSVGCNDLLGGGPPLGWNNGPSIRVGPLYCEELSDAETRPTRAQTIQTGADLSENAIV